MILMGKTFLHKKTKNKYLVIARGVQTKVNNQWLYDFVLYHPVNSPEVLYSREYDDFINSFELVN